MPINCPLDFGATRECRGCRSNTGGLCYEFSPAKPLSEILTVEERLSILEGALVQEDEVANEWPVMPKWKPSTKDLKGTALPKKYQTEPKRPGAPRTKGVEV